MDSIRDKEDLLRFMYELLPAVYRRRDKELSAAPLHQLDSAKDQARDTDLGPLGEFLNLFADQAILLNQDIGSLYDNWFIETCQEWVVPYIADLIGYQLIRSPLELADEAAKTQRERPTVLSVRREVANTIGYRRRKGSLALLEILARDIAGWYARAVEFYPLIAASPSIRYANPHEEAPQKGVLVNIHDAKGLDLLESINGACNGIAHTIDVRRIASVRTPGRFNISNVGVFACRLKIFSVTNAPARSQEERGVPYCYTFSALGNDTALFTKPQDETNLSQIAGPLNLPIPIRRRALSIPNLKKVGQRRIGPDGEGNMTKREKNLAAAAEPAWIANKDYYGSQKSLFITVAGWSGLDGDIEAEKIISADLIIPADLSEWRYRPLRGYIALDPELGRIAFHPQERPRDVWVTYYYAFPDELGGGEYKRSLAPCRPNLPTDQSTDMSLRCYSVCTRTFASQDRGTFFRSVQTALAKWAEERPTKAIIEIQDSAVYDEPDAGTIRLYQDQELQFRAKNGCRPIVRFLDRFTGRPESLLIEGENGSRLELNGLCIAGRGLEVKKNLAELMIAHSTLVPGWDVEEEREGSSKAVEDSKKVPAGKPSLSLEAVGVSVVISHSILGPIHVNAGSPNQKMTLRIDNSIVDASGADQPAICGENAENSAALFLRNNTILGKVHAHVIESADNTIFTHRVYVKRQQVGCIRFCYVPPESHTPRRYNCQPDLAIADLREWDKKRQTRRVHPIFTSTQYGNPAYCQLSYGCALEITTGAEDQSEMGVFHDLFQAQRARALQVRLNEYVPGGYESKVLFIN